MLIILDEYYLLKEVIAVTRKTASYYVCNYQEKIITIKHTRYIKRDVIAHKYRKRLTNLYNHIPIKTFCEYIGISYLYLKGKVDFMKKYKNVEFFKYKEIGKSIYIIVDNELKKYLERYTPFRIHIKNDYEHMNIKASKSFANYIIGFY